MDIKKPVKAIKEFKVENGSDRTLWDDDLDNDIDANWAENIRQLAKKKGLVLIIPKPSGENNG